MSIIHCNIERIRLRIIHTRSALRISIHDSQCKFLFRFSNLAEIFNYLLYWNLIPFWMRTAYSNADRVWICLYTRADIADCDHALLVAILCRVRKTSENRLKIFQKIAFLRLRYMLFFANYLHYFLPFPLGFFTRFVFLYLLEMNTVLDSARVC